MKAIPKIIVLLVTFLPGLFFRTFPLSAANGNNTIPTSPTPTNNTIPTGPIVIENPFKGGSSLFALLRTIIDEIVLPIGGVLIVLAFIYTGFLYVKSRGDTKKIGEAHSALLNTSIGAAVLLGAWMFANVICKTIQQLGGPECPV